MKNVVTNLARGVAFFALFFAIIPLAACGDDATSKVDETGEIIGPDGEVIPDSILASDSLYDWYMDELSKGKSPLKPDGSSSSGDITGDEDEDDAKVHMLPPAGFYSEMTVPVPLPLYGGKIRCTFNGSMPTKNTPEFTEAYEVTRNTPVRCAEFVKDTIVRKSSHTFFINETVNMPVVAITVDSVFFR